MLKELTAEDKSKSPKEFQREIFKLLNFQTNNRQDFLTNNTNKIESVKEFQKKLPKKISKKKPNEPLMQLKQLSMQPKQLSNRFPKGFPYKFRKKLRKLSSKQLLMEYPN